MRELLICLDLKSIVAALECIRAGSLISRQNVSNTCVGWPVLKELAELNRREAERG